jgi:5-methylcytosine-specific restriction endonuclease McrA
MAREAKRRRWVKVFHQVGGRLRSVEPWVRAIGWELARTSNSQLAIVTEDEFAARVGERRAEEEEETRDLYRRAVRQLVRVGFLEAREDSEMDLILSSMDSIKIEENDRGRARRNLGNALRFEVLSSHGFACRYCGRRAPFVALEVEHVVPVALGGTSERKNLVPACTDCNAGKGKRHVALVDEG